PRVVVAAMRLQIVPVEGGRRIDRRRCTAVGVVFGDTDVYAAGLELLRERRHETSEYEANPTKPQFTGERRVEQRIGFATSTFNGSETAVTAQTKEPAAVVRELFREDRRTTAAQSRSP